MRPRTWWLPALVLAMGCGSPRWGQFHSDVQSQGSIGVNTPPSLVVKWNLSTPRIGYASPVIANDGKILIGTATGQMIAISPDGVPAWTFNANTAYSDAVITSAAATTDDGDVYFLASGTPASTDSSLGALSKFRSTLFHLGGDGGLKCSAQLDFTIAQLRSPYTFTTAAPKVIRSDGQTAVFVPMGLTLYAFNDLCQRIALEPLQCSGDIRVPVAGVIDLDELTRYASKPGDPGPGAFGTWYEPSDAQTWITPTVAVTDRVDGNVLRRPIVVVAQNGCGVHAYEWTAPPSQQLAHLWYNATLSDTFLSSPAISTAGQVAIGNSQGYVWSYDVVTGKEQWFYKTGEPMLATPAFYAGSLNVYAIGLQHAWALDNNGALLNQVSLTSPSVSSPSLSFDAAFFSTRTSMHSLTPNLATLTSEPSGAGGISSPAVGADGTVYTAAPFGVIAYRGR